MAELALNLDSFNRIDDEIKSQVLAMAEEEGLSPTQFLKSLLQRFNASAEEWELGEETQQSLIEGTAEYEAGKLKTYGSWKDLLADKKSGKK